MYLLCSCQSCTFTGKMWSRILCFTMIVLGALGEDDALSRLYGMEGRNRVLLCLKATEEKRERVCPGVLLHEEWVGVRAGCLRQHPPGHMLVLRLTDAERCDDLTHGYSSQRSRSVRAHFYHPWSNLALVIVDRPYLHLDVHPNSTAWTVSRTFKQHGMWKWMKKYIKAFALTRDPHYHYKQVMHDMAATQSPLLVFILAIFLPTVLFVLVFIYVIFYSGSSSEIPYKNLQCAKKATQV